MVKGLALIFIPNTKSEYGLIVFIAVFSAALSWIAILSSLGASVEAVEGQSLQSGAVLVQSADADLYEEICDSLIVELINNQINTDCNDDSSQDPAPIGLPTDVPGELPEEDKDGLNESVAGNEELIAQPADTVEQASNNVAATINTDIPRRALRVVADAATAAGQDVLGVQATEEKSSNSAPDRNPVVASSAQKPSPPKEGTTLWWILGVGFVMVILPATFAYARQRNQ